MTKTIRLHRTSTGYSCGRFSIKRQYDSGYGRGSMKATGWIVSDETGRIVTTQTDLGRVREYLAFATKEA